MPALDHELVSEADVAELKKQVLATGVSVSDLVSTAWAAASSFRGSDKRGGVNGGRIRLEPQKSWEVNEPGRLAPVVAALEGVQSSFNAAQTGGKRVSFADLVVIGGAAAVEKAAQDAGVTVDRARPPGPHRRHPGADRRRVVLLMEPQTEGFRNYLGKGSHLPAEFTLVDKANLLGLSAPQMTVLVGGLRVLGANYQESSFGVLTDRPGTLTNDFFVHLVDMDVEWHGVGGPEATVFEATDAGGATRWTGTRNDLVFGCNSELRAVTEVYAADDAQDKFVRDFVDAWVKVMDADRFDLHR